MILFVVEIWESFGNQYHYYISKIEHRYESIENDTCQDDQQIKHGHAGPDLDEALPQQIDEATVKPLERTDGDTNHGADDRQHEAKQLKQSTRREEPEQNVSQKRLAKSWGRAVIAKRPSI